MSDPASLSYLTLFLIFTVTFLTKTYGVIIGGASFLLQPFLLAMGIPPHIAIAHDIAGTNGSNISGIYVFNKTGHLRYDIALYAMPGFITGPLLGVYLLDITPPEILEIFIATVSIVGAFYLIIKRNNSTGLFERPKPKNWRVLTILYGFIFGAYLGFSGAGAGIVVTLFYISTLGMTMTQAIATKRLMHGVPFLIAATGYLWQGWLQLDLFLTVFAGCLAAGYAGSHITLKVNNKILRLFFLVSAILMAGFIIVRR